MGLPDKFFPCVSRPSRRTSSDASSKTASAKTNSATTPFAASFALSHGARSRPTARSQPPQDIRSIIERRSPPPHCPLLRVLPWQRIVGAGGEIKLRGEAAAEQRLRLTMEGVRFRGKRVDMEIYEHTLRSWETL